MCSDRGRPMSPGIASSSALVRGWCTKWVASMNSTPFAAAASVIFLAELWSTKGLSTRTCWPAAIAARAISSFAEVGVAT